MSENIRVSVIVPVYNVESYIEECLASVGNQTYARCIECLVVDDKGNDNSIHVAEKYVEDYRGDAIFKIIYREQNGGLSAARNSGVREARGEYIYFLDSDDYLLPDAIEKLLLLADKHGGVDLLPALYKRDDGSMDHFTPDAFPEFSDCQSEIKHALLNFDRLPVTAANRLVRRELFIGNNLWFKEGIIHEDNYWTFFLAKHVKHMAFLPEKIYYYRATDGSITKAPNIKKESLAFKTLITDFCNNIDSFEASAQKTLILNTIIIMFNGRYYESEADKNKLVALFASKNSWYERILLQLYLASRNSKILHLLIRIYNL